MQGRFLSVKPESRDHSLGGTEPLQAHQNLGIQNLRQRNSTLLGSWLSWLLWLSCTCPYSLHSHVYQKTALPTWWIDRFWFFNFRWNMSQFLVLSLTKIKITKNGNFLHSLFSFFFLFQPIAIIIFFKCKTLHLKCKPPRNWPTLTCSKAETSKSFFLTSSSVMIQPCLCVIGTYTKYDSATV